MCISVSSHAPGARDSGDSAQSHLPAQLRGWRIKLRSSRLEFVFSCQSCELVCRAGVSPPEYGEWATGAVAPQLRRESSRLNARRRSVSEKAPMQNQFSECPRFGRSCIEEQRRRRGMRIRNEREFIDAKSDSGKFCVIARPAFR